MSAADIGPVLLIVGAVLLVPVAFASGLVIAAIVGWALKDRGEAAHEGSELIELNR